MFNDHSLMYLALGIKFNAMDDNKNDMMNVLMFVVIK